MQIHVTFTFTFISKYSYILCPNTITDVIYEQPHTRTVVRECCKGDDASQWRNPKFDRPPRSNPISDSHKSWQRWLRRGPLHLCKSSSRSAQGFRFRACVTLRTKSVYSASFFSVFWGSCNSLQPRPLNRFWCKICQNTRFRARMCLFGVAIIKSNI